MKNIVGSILEGVVNEAMDGWEISGEIDIIGGPGAKSTSFKADRKADYIAIMLDNQFIQFCSLQDIEEIDNENELNSQLYNSVVDLRAGESYYDKSGNTIYVAIK